MAGVIVETMFCLFLFIETFRASQNTFTANGTSKAKMAKIAVKELLLKSEDVVREIEEKAGDPRIADVKNKLDTLFEFAGVSRKNKKIEEEEFPPFFNAVEQELDPGSFNRIDQEKLRQAYNALVVLRKYLFFCRRDYLTQNPDYLNILMIVMNAVGPEANPSGVVDQGGYQQQGMGFNY